MLKKKINSIIERTKVLFKERKKEICLGALGVVLLGTLGFAAATLSSTDSKEVASNKTSVTEKAENNKTDKNKTENKKEDTNKEETSSKEETKKEDTKTEGTNTSSTENKTESNEGTSNTSNESTSSGSSSSSSSSSNSGVTNKPSTGGSSSSGSSSSGSTSKPEAHTHSWNPITTTVHHDEVGHWEDVLVQDAWTEEVPIYEERELSVCNGCGKDITSDPWGHIEEQMLAGNLACGGYHSEWKQVQVGTNKVNHGAVYDKKYVVDKAAWDETVITGYQCSCGATK